MSLKNHGWREVIKTLGKFDYVPVRQSGSHIVVKNSKDMWQFLFQDVIHYQKER